MPLSKVRKPTKGNCRANISRNIRTLKAEGREQGQAVAIALSVAKKAGCRVGKKKAAKKGHAAGRRLTLTAGVIDEAATEKLRAIKKLAVRNRGDLQSAIVSASHYAKKSGEEMRVYKGNSYGAGVWRVSANPGEYLDPVNNTGAFVLTIKPDLSLYRSEVVRAMPAVADSDAEDEGTAGHASGISAPGSRGSKPLKNWSPGRFPDQGLNDMSFTHVPPTLVQYRNVVADALVHQHGLSEADVKRVMSRRGALKWIDASFHATKYPSLMAHELMALEEERTERAARRGHTSGRVRDAAIKVRALMTAYVKTGASRDEAARLVLRNHTQTAMSALEDIGMEPSSEVDLRALQRAFDKSYARGLSTGTRPAVPAHMQSHWLDRGVDLQRAVDRARKVTAARKRIETPEERRRVIMHFTQAGREFAAAGDHEGARLFFEAADLERRGIDTRNMELPAGPLTTRGHASGSKTRRTATKRKGR